MVFNRFSEEYKKYIKSPRWKALREQLIKLRGGCERCGKASNLQVHHVTYERLGKESPSDLEVLCYDCHKLADIERQAEAEEEAYDRRVDGWATKCWGENWIRRYNWGYAYEKFEEWLEKKEAQGGWW